MNVAIKIQESIGITDKNTAAGICSIVPDTLIFSNGSWYDLNSGQAVHQITGEHFKPETHQNMFELLNKMDVEI